MHVLAKYPAPRLLTMQLPTSIPTSNELILSWRLRSNRDRGLREPGGSIQEADAIKKAKGYPPMKRISGILCGLAILTTTTLAAVAQDHAKLDERLTSAQAVIQEVMATPDKGIPQSILAGASCVIVIPSYKKGALIVGAQYGQGVATCRTHNGWSAPVFIQLTGGSLGWQIGGQATDLVLVAMNQNGMQDMLKSKFKLGADAAATAGPVGRNAQASTDASMRAEFLTYSRSHGLFVGIDLDGTVLSQNADDTRAEYGADLPFDVVLKGNKTVPANARAFVSTVAKYFVISKDNQKQ
jgi:lipid-binding SYLF domain-containing protein